MIGMCIACLCANEGMCMWVCTNVNAYMYMYLWFEQVSVCV